jgi:hypothetical protein
MVYKCISEKYKHLWDGLNSNIKFIKLTYKKSLINLQIVASPYGSTTIKQNKFLPHILKGGVEARKEKGNFCKEKETSKGPVRAIVGSAEVFSVEAIKPLRL